jgi:hypothetical protein
MKRREFVSLLAGAAAWPLGATRDVGMYFPKIGDSTLRPTRRDSRVGFSNLIHCATHPQPSSYVAPHILQCVGEVVGRHAETFRGESRSESLLIPFLV